MSICGAILAFIEGSSLLEFSPWRGQLQPQSATTIEALFCPQEAKSFDLLSTWKIGKSKFHLPVKAQVHRVEVSMWILDDQGGRQQLRSDEKKLKILNFGQVNVFDFLSLTSFDLDDCHGVFH